MRLILTSIAVCPICTEVQFFSTMSKNHSALFKGLHVNAVIQICLRTNTNV